MSEVPTASQVLLSIDILSLGISGDDPLTVAARRTISSALGTRGWSGRARENDTPYGTPPTTLDDAAQAAVRALSVINATFASNPEATLSAAEFRSVISDAKL